MRIFEPICGRLNEAGVRYVVVGGLATVLHGHLRFTADLDLVVDLAPDAASRAVRALEEVGLAPRAPVPAESFGDAATRERWIREKGMEVFSMWDPADPLRVVDLFVRHPIDFEELWQGSVAMPIGGTEVRVASIPHLIRLKRLSDRPLDRDDIQKLEEIERQRGRT